MVQQQKNIDDLKKDFILILLPIKQKNLIRELSKTEDRSLSSFCLNAINQYLVKIGVNPSNNEEQ